MIKFTKEAKIATGASRPNEWAQRQDGAIMAQIDTSSAGFKKTPIYLTAMYGNQTHSLAIGISSIYDPSPTGFTLYIRRVEGPEFSRADLTITNAQRWGWYVQWIGIED